MGPCGRNCREEPALVELEDEIASSESEYDPSAESSSEEEVKKKHVKKGNQKPVKGKKKGQK